MFTITATIHITDYFIFFKDLKVYQEEPCVLPFLYINTHSQAKSLDLVQSLVL